MSGVHFTEILLLAVIALIVLGPERLPAIARTVGKISRQARNAWQGVQSELQAELDLDHNRKIMQAANTEDASSDTESGSQTVLQPDPSAPHPSENTADSDSAIDEGLHEPQR